MLGRLVLPNAVQFNRNCPPRGQEVSAWTRKDNRVYGSHSICFSKGNGNGTSFRDAAVVSLNRIPGRRDTIRAVSAILRS